MTMLLFVGLNQSITEPPRFGASLNNSCLKSFDELITNRLMNVKHDLGALKADLLFFT